MTRATGGNNRRTADTTDGDTYLTPIWSIDYLLRYWQPPAEAVICDPCACGYAGHSIGRYVADRAGSAGVELSDISPLHPSVERGDFRALRLPERRRVVITNPPYNRLAAFVRWALLHAEEVVVLTRFGFLCSENGARATELYQYIQPPKRLAFELLPHQALTWMAVNLLTPGRYDVHIDPATLTGYRMSSTGVDHGWAVYRRGYDGPVQLLIQPMPRAVTGQQSLFGGTHHV